MATLPLASPARWPREDRTSCKALCHKLLRYGNTPKNNKATGALWPTHRKTACALGIGSDRSATSERQSVESFEICKEIEISAPIDIAFEAMLDELGPEGQMPGGKPFPMKIEPWPGGRWYRDLGNNSGHLWGHVQVIKPPTLLEICGPLMMSDLSWVNTGTLPV